MFTGIIQHQGHVHRLEPTASGRRLVIHAAGWRHIPSPGDSIAVSGVCLTVAAPPADGLLSFDVITETLNLTTLGDLAPGDRVNLEHAMRADGMMDGHLVQGHVDGVGVVREVRHDLQDYRVTIAPPAALMEYVTPKGSVTVNGVSLTVAAAGDDTFTIALIPTTLALTTFGTMATGDRVNIETDIVARTIVHWLRRYGHR